MEQKKQSLFNLAVIVGALGYFVDIYDLLLFSIVRVPSLKSLGLSADDIARRGADIISTQMIGLLIGVLPLRSRLIDGPFRHWQALYRID